MNPDRRAWALRLFHRISLIVCCALTIATVAHGIGVTIPQIRETAHPTELDLYLQSIPEASALLEEPGPIADKSLVKKLLATDPIRSDHLYLAVLDGITTLQLAAGAVLFGLLSRRDRNPFSPWSGRCLLALAALTALQVAVKWAFVDGYIYTNYLFIPGAPRYYPAMFRPLHIIDLPSCLLAATLFAMSFLIRYGTELYRDSEEIA